MRKGLIALLLLIALGACNQPAPVSAKANKPIELNYKKMDKDEFWKIIEKARQESNGDQDLHYKILVETLSAYEPEHIIQFEIIFEQFVRDADDYKIVAAQKIIEGGVTDDTYLYFRCWLIAQGEQVFLAALNNPDTLTDVAEGGFSTDFEELLYVATAAYHKRTGIKEEDDTFPRGKASALGLNYDFDAPPTKGKDWKVEDLPKMYPGLWAKFH